MSRAMKASKIPFAPQIPETWEEIPNRFLFLEHSSKVGERWKEYQLLSLTTNGVKEKNINDTGGKVPDSYDNYQTVERGDMVFCLFDLDCSAVFSGLSTYDGMITSAYDVFRTNEKYLDNTYARFWFDYVFSRRYYKMFSKNIRYTITTDVFKSIYTPCPPIEEQKRIGAFLDKKCGEIDEMVLLQENIVEELKAYKQSVITEAVCKGLNPDVPMKDSGVEWIGQIPEEWEAAPFKSVFSLGKGLSITKADLVEAGIPVISYGQIHSKLNTGTRIKDELIRFIPDTFLGSNVDALVKKGDIIFADTSEDLEGCGNCIYIDRNDTLFAGYHTIIARNQTKEHNNYFSYLFQTDCWRKQIRSVVNGVKLFSVPQKTLSATSIIIPPVEAQIAIGKYLDTKCAEIDALISLKQSKIDALKEYKKSIIYEYITGKKEL